MELWTYCCSDFVTAACASCAPDASDLQRCKIIYCPHPVGLTEGPEDDFEKENPVYDF